MNQTVPGNKNVSKTDFTRNPAQSKGGVGRDSSLNSTLKRADKGQGSQKLGQILLKEGLITAAQLDEAVKIMEKTRIRLGRILVRLGYLEEKTIVECLARQYNYPIIDLENHLIAEKVIKQIPYDLAKKHFAVPVDYRDNTLIIAMADPTDSIAIEDIQFKTNLSIKPTLTTEKNIIESVRVTFHEYFNPSASRPYHRIVPLGNFTLPDGECFFEFFWIRAERWFEEQGIIKFVTHTTIECNKDMFTKMQPGEHLLVPEYF